MSVENSALRHQAIPIAAGHAKKLWSVTAFRAGKSAFTMNTVEFLLAK
jgi:hypothetical protein